MTYSTTKYEGKKRKKTLKDNYQLKGGIARYTLKNGDVRWGYVIDKGKDANGKRQLLAKQGFETRAKAKEERDQLLAPTPVGMTAQGQDTPDLEHESRQEPTKSTFSELFDRWIREHWERNCEATTTEGYIKKGAYAKHHLGDSPIAKITPLQIQIALNDLRDSWRQEDGHASRRPTAFRENRPGSRRRYQHDL